MLFKKIGTSLIFIFVSNHVFSQDSISLERLQEQRAKTVTNYINALQHADIAIMNTLFISEGKVISTSKGKIAANQFFSGFLSELKSAKVTQKKVYSEVIPGNDYAASFYFSWVEKNGKSGGGYYMDQFIFDTHSNKLKEVIMFENKFAQ